MYKPNPIDTSNIALSADLQELTEQLAHQVHEVWAKSRVDQGWSYGKERNDTLKQTPCLVPYDQLPEIEKQYDRDTAMETLKLIISLGYEIKRK